MSDVSILFTLIAAALALLLSGILKFRNRFSASQGGSNRKGK